MPEHWKFIFCVSLISLLLSVNYITAQDRPIRIAYNQSNPPYKYVNDKGEADGILIDYWKLWSETNAIPVEFIPAPFIETVEMVRDGRADLHAGLFQTAERDEYLDFTDPIFEVTYYIMHHKNLLGINNADDLKGLLVGVPSGGFTDHYMQENFPDLHYKRYDDYPSLFDAAQKGEIRVFIAPIENLNQYMCSLDESHDYQYKMGKPLFSQFYRGAIAEGKQEMLDVLNRGLKKVSSYEMALLERKWLGISRQRASDDVLVIAMNMQKQPYSFIDPYGKPAGLYVDFWNLWSQTTGKEISFLPSSSVHEMQSVFDGFADCTIGQSLSEYALSKLVFSKSFYQVDASLFHLSDQSYPNDITKLENVILGVIKDSSLEGYCLKKLPQSSLLKQFDTNNEMLYSLISGDIDLMFLHTQIGKLLLLKERFAGQVEARKPIYTTAVHTGVLPKNKKLLDIINQGIDNIPKTKLAKIEQRWIPESGNSFWHKDMEGEVESDYTSLLTEVEKKWIAEHPLIRVGADPGFQPFEFINEDGEHSGIASDYIAMINQRMGLNMQVIPYPTWSEVIDKTKSREIDVLCAVMATEERQKYLNFSQPYITSPEMIFTRKNAPFIGSVRDLNGKTIAIKDKSYIQDRLQNQYPYLKLALYDTTYEAIFAVSNGEADAYINTLAHGSYVISEYNFTNVVVAAPMDGMVDGITFAIRNDWPILLNIISKALSTISEDEAAELRAKWITVRFEHGKEARQILFWSSIAFIMLITMTVIAFLWNRTLKYEISRRKEMEVSLRKAKEQAESADRLKSAFLASMSHELRTPLNSIIGFTGIMMQEMPGPLNNEQKKQLSMVQASSRHLLTLINDVLDISKIEAGQLQIVETEFNLSDSVRKVVHSIEPLTEKKSLKIACEIDNKIGMIVSDSRRIEQILLNLLSNAVKFTEEGGINVDVRIVTTLKPPVHKSIRFTVEDTGIGIEEKDLDKLFKPFQQVETGLTRRYEGTGLGLSICKKLAELLGGKITVKSQWTKGSTFTLFIPYKIK